jgi:hypothetical protein
MRLVIVLAGIALISVLALSPSTAGSSVTGPEQLQLSLASALRPSHGGPPAAPLGFLPLHPREFALAKAAANNRAGLGVNNAKPPEAVAAGRPSRAIRTSRRALTALTRRG